MNPNMPTPIISEVGMRNKSEEANSLNDCCALDTPSSRCARQSFANNAAPRSFRASSIVPNISPGSSE